HPSGGPSCDGWNRDACRWREFDRWTICRRRMRVQWSPWRRAFGGKHAHRGGGLRQARGRGRIQIRQELAKEELPGGEIKRRREKARGGHFGKLDRRYVGEKPFRGGTIDEREGRSHARRQRIAGGDRRD